MHSFLFQIKEIQQCSHFLWWHSVHINWTKKQAKTHFRRKRGEVFSSNSLFITLFRLIRHHQVGTKRFHGIHPPHLLFKQGQLHNMKILWNWEILKVDKFTTLRCGATYLIQVSYLIQIFSLNPASSLTHCTRFFARFLIKQLIHWKHQIKIIKIQHPTHQ